MYDDSGAAYCAKIVDQKLQAVPGACGQQSSPSVAAQAEGPVIVLNGANPAQVQVGATYNDLGASITGPSDDLNLGISASVDGASSTPMSSVALDTSQAGTHTIVFSATDQNGVTSSVTRTVVVGSEDLPNDPPEATTTAPTPAPEDVPPPADTATDTSSVASSTSDTAPQNDAPAEQSAPQPDDTSASTTAPVSDAPSS